jgi:hypothetical protein
MTTSMIASDLSDEDFSTQKLTSMTFGLNKDGSTVPVDTIFYDLIRRLNAAAKDDATVVVLTATNKIFQEYTEMTNEAFQKAFQVKNTVGKISKVLLGFKIHTMMKAV